MTSKSISILLISLIATSSIFAVVPLDNPGIPLKKNIRTKPESAQPITIDDIPGGSDLTDAVYFGRTDPITGHIQLLTGTGIDIPGFTQVNETTADGAAMAFVENYGEMIGVSADDIRVESVNWLRDRVYVHLRQYYGSIPLWGGDLNLIIHPTARVSFVRNDLVPGIDAVPPAVISEDAAVSVAINYVKPLDEPRRIDRLGLYVYPLWTEDSYEIRVAWVTRILCSNPRGLFQITVDASSGAVLSATNELRTVEVSGNLTGMYHYQFKDDPLEIAYWPDALVTVDTYEIYTDDTGDWEDDISASAPFTYNTRHYGRYCDVDNGAGSDVSYTTNFTSSPYNFGWSLSTSTEDEMNLYYHVNRIHTHVRDTLGFGGMNYRMPCLVNDPSTADNAYYDGSGINFGAGETTFYDLSLFCDIVYHEYTHGVTHHIYPYGSLPYDGQSGALDEGFSDYFPCSMTDSPLMGDGGLYRSGTEYMRRCNTSRSYPDDWVGEVHADAQIVDAAWWEIRDELGRDYTDSLVHLTRFTFAEDFEEFFWATLATDDDDADIYNGTPNARLIYDSYGAHGIGPGYNLIVEHDPLPNTEVTTGNYSVRATFIATLGIEEDSARVYYRTDGGSWTSVDLSEVFGVYRANIPAQPLGTSVDYYIYCVDNGGYPICSPSDAPSVWHSFDVIEDTVAPTIFATPVTNWFEYAWPPQLTATVTDEHGIASVEIHGRIGTEDLLPTSMVESDTPNVWHGGLPGIPLGNDTVQYWIEATDVALSPHTSVFPATGSFFAVVLPGYNENMEVSGRGLRIYVIRSGYVNQWNTITLNNPYSSGSLCYAFTDASYGEYGDQASGALSTPELRIGDPATLTFWHRMRAEDHSSYPSYAWDGGIVEVSTDGGVTWIQVEPSPGYNKQIMDNPASPFDEDTPCYSGEISWRQETLDMAPFAPRAMVRFQFGSDAHVTDEGWFIDDVQLVTVFPNVEEDIDRPDMLSIKNVHPNPFNSDVVIEYSLPKGTHAKIDIYDLSGRMIREFNLSENVGSIIWDGDDISGAELPSGLYFARIQSAESSDVARMILLK